MSVQLVVVKLLDAHSQGDRLRVNDWCPGRMQDGNDRRSAWDSVVQQDLTVQLAILLPRIIRL